MTSNVEHFRSTFTNVPHVERRTYVQRSHVPHDVNIWYEYVTWNFCSTFTRCRTSYVEHFCSTFTCAARREQCEQMCRTTRVNAEPLRWTFREHVNVEREQKCSTFTKCAARCRTLLFNVTHVSRTMWTSVHNVERFFPGGGERFKTILRKKEFLVQFFQLFISGSAGISRIFE